MVQVDEKYLPEISERIMTIKQQIEESKKIIYREVVELSDPEYARNNQSRTSSEFNISELKRKIDVLTSELDKLQA